jgi:hypothetical protein
MKSEYDHDKHRDEELALSVNRRRKTGWIILEIKIKILFVFC